MPLFFALPAGCVSIIFSLGYRGKHAPPVEPMSLGKAALVFIGVSFIAYVVAYVLRRFGIPIGRGDK